MARTIIRQEWFAQFENARRKKEPKVEKSYPMAFVETPGRIEFRERKLQELHDHDVLIKVKAASICGSDLHIFRGAHPSVSFPVPIGHELSGEVYKIGSRVSKLKAGDRVVVEPVIVCGLCDSCKRGYYNLCRNISFHYREGQGGFASYFIADENWVHLLPDNISYEEGAMIEPLAVGIHAVKKAGLQFGHSTAVFGAGPIGLIVLLLTKLVGWGEVFVLDILDVRLQKARELGASLVINNTAQDAVGQILDKTGELGVDQSFEAVGLEKTLIQSLEILRKGGRSILVPKQARMRMKITVEPGPKNLRNLS